MKKIKEIWKKYNDYVFRLAVTHLFSVGIENLKNINIDVVAKECIENTPDNYPMTGEFRAQLMRCAYELAQLPMWDILKFVQTEIKIDNTTVHPNVFVQFRSASTNEEYLSFALPADTSEFDVEEIVERIDQLKEQHKSLHGSLYEFPYRKAIRSALEEKGIKAAELPVDHTIYI